MRKWTKRVLLVVLVLFVTSSGILFATGQNEKVENGKKQWTIGVTTQGWKHEFIKNLVNALEATANEMDDVTLILLDSDDSVEKQLNDVDTMIIQGVDGIIMNVNSYEGCSNAVVACNEAGIPVVQVVSYTENENYNCFVGTDVKSSGILAAEVMAEILGEKGRVFMIEGLMGHSGQINRNAGMMEAFPKYPGIEVVEKQSAEWSKDKAMGLTENWLTKYDDIDGIIAQNDGMALGSMNAVIASGRNEIKVIGIDGDSEALQAVIDGTFAATILDDVWTEAKIAVETMRDILEGKSVKKEIIIDYVPIVTVEKAKEFLSQRGK